jgi:hypothetical protein
MKSRFGRLLTKVGSWIVDFGVTVREIGDAVAYARSHPTEVPDHDTLYERVKTRAAEKNRAVEVDIDKI